MLSVPIVMSGIVPYFSKSNRNRVEHLKQTTWVCRSVCRMDVFDAHSGHGERSSGISGSGQRALAQVRPVRGAAAVRSLSAFRCKFSATRSARRRRRSSACDTRGTSGAQEASAAMRSNQGSSDTTSSCGAGLEE